MRDQVHVAVLDPPRYGLCHYCGFNLPLRRQVTYYGTWPVDACMACGQTIQRHTNWLRDARSRYLENRRQRAVAAPSPAS